MNLPNLNGTVQLCLHDSTIYAQRYIGLANSKQSPTSRALMVLVVLPVQFAFDTTKDPEHVTRRTSASSKCVRVLNVCECVHVTARLGSYFNNTICDTSFLYTHLLFIYKKTYHKTVTVYRNLLLKFTSSFVAIPRQFTYARPSREHMQ